MIMSQHCRELLTTYLILSLFPYIFRLLCADKPASMFGGGEWKVWIFCQGELIVYTHSGARVECGAGGPTDRILISDL